MSIRNFNFAILFPLGLLLGGCMASGPAPGSGNAASGKPTSSEATKAGSAKSGGAAASGKGGAQNVSLATPQKNATGAVPLRTAVAERARVTDLVGSAVYLPAGQASGTAGWKPVRVGDVLSYNTRVKTSKSSALLLLLAGKHVVRVGAETDVVLRELGKDKKYSFSMATGQLWSLVQHASRPTRYEVTTPSAVVGVAGTLFTVGYNPKSTATQVSTADGEVTVRQGRKGTRVRRGYQTRVKRNQAAPFRPLAQSSSEKTKWRTLRREEGWLSRPDSSSERSFLPLLRLNNRPGGQLPAGLAQLAAAELLGGGKGRGAGRSARLGGGDLANAAAAALGGRSDKDVARHLVQAFAARRLDGDIFDGRPSRNGEGRSGPKFAAPFMGGGPGNRPFGGPGGGGRPRTSGGRPDGLARVVRELGAGKKRSPGNLEDRVRRQINPGNNFGLRPGRPQKGGKGAAPGRAVQAKRPAHAPRERSPLRNSGGIPKRQWDGAVERLRGRAPRESKPGRRAGERKPGRQKDDFWGVLAGAAPRNKPGDRPGRGREKNGWANPGFGLGRDDRGKGWGGGRDDGPGRGRGPEKQPKKRDRGGGGLGGIPWPGH